MPTDPIELTFTYIYEDFYPSKSNARRGETPWVSILGWVLIVGAALSVFLFFAHKPDAQAPGIPAAPQTDWGRWGIYSVAIGAVVFSILRERLGRKKSFDAALQQPLHLVFSHAGVVIEMPTSRTEQQWTTYTAFTEDARGFTLKTRTGNGLFIPHRVIPSEQVAALRNLLEVCTKPTQGFPVQTNSAPSAAPPR